MAYGDNEEEAARKVKAVALQILADMIESGGSARVAEGSFRRVSHWRATKARRVYAALLRIGWTLKKQVGSHRRMQRAGWPSFTFSFHDGEEVGPPALAKIAKESGLKPEDL
jgi:predicted RNA binding protein YcfA (HicA-like mRNA interferase family)